ncbi:MAG TPA: hypothetical protein VFQ54_00910 [Thermomicrobiales bacterium]|nr:hypothetical protein [Thermomicrobiales bacterium]
MTRVYRLRTSLLVALLALGFTLGVAISPASASRTLAIAAATPGTPVAQTSANPKVGDAVDYINESGGVIATLTVSKVVQPWDEYGDYYAPDPGSEYVAFAIDIEHFGTRGDLLISPDDFYLQDVDGFLLSRSWSAGADDAKLKPTTDPIAISPGKTTEVVIVFEVLQGVDLSDLYWQPDFDRLITLANLRS